MEVGRVHADVSKEEGIQALMDAALENFNALDVFVNNSGFNGEEVMPYEMTLEQSQRNRMTIFKMNRKNKSSLRKFQ